jgi:signal peptidase I
VTAQDKQGRALGGYFAALTSVLIVALIGLAVAVAAVPMLAGGQSLSVKNSAMSPVINPGDLVVTKGVGDPADIQVGQIIAFSADGSRSALRIRWVSGETTTASGRHLITRANAAAEPDKLTVAESDVMGIYMYRIPKLGFAVDWADQHGVSVIIVLSVLVVVLGAAIFVMGLHQRRLRGRTDPQGDAAAPDTSDRRPTQEKPNTPWRPGRPEGGLAPEPPPALGAASQSGGPVSPLAVTAGRVRQPGRRSEGAPPPDMSRGAPPAGSRRPPRHLVPPEPASPLMAAGPKRAVPPSRIPIRRDSVTGPRPPLLSEFPESVRRRSGRPGGDEPTSQEAGPGDGSWAGVPEPDRPKPIPWVAGPPADPAKTRPSGRDMSNGGEAAYRPLRVARQRSAERVVSTRPDTVAKPVAFMPHGPGVEGVSTGELPIRRPHRIGQVESVADKLPRARIPADGVPRPWGQPETPAPTARTGRSSLADKIPRAQTPPWPLAASPGVGTRAAARAASQQAAEDDLSWLDEAGSRPRPWDAT